MRRRTNGRKSKIFKGCYNIFCVQFIFWAILKQPNSIKMLLNKFFDLWIFLITKHMRIGKLQAFFSTNLNLFQSLTIKLLPLLQYILQFKEKKNWNLHLRAEVCYQIFSRNFMPTVYPFKFHSFWGLIPTLLSTGFIKCKSHCQKCDS